MGMIVGTYHTYLLARITFSSNFTLTTYYLDRQRFKSSLTLRKNVSAKVFYIETHIHICSVVDLRIFFFSVLTCQNRVVQCICISFVRIFLPIFSLKLGRSELLLPYSVVVRQKMLLKKFLFGKSRFIDTSFGYK